MSDLFCQVKRVSILGDDEIQFQFVPGLAFADEPDVTMPILLVGLFHLIHSHQGEVVVGDGNRGGAWPLDGPVLV